MNIALSELVPSRTNPRKVKPEKDAHARLVASIRAHGLLEPLIVRPENGHYQVIAGHRRLAALKAIHRDDLDVKVPCVVKKVDAEGAEEIAVAENFIREAMHPLDEAEAFARMASEDRKGIEAIAAEFGVGESYVRQRMKLAGLCKTVKAAYRSGAIDTATAEAFSAVPESRQLEVWEETGGNPRHAQHVRNLIEHRWIDAKHALFDVASLPPETVSSDLFQNCILIERSAFMQTQATALEAERGRLIEDGWSEVVIGEHADVQGRLYSMDEPEPEFSKANQARIDTLIAKRTKLESSDDEEVDNTDEWESIQSGIDTIVASAVGRYSEETKCRGTVFLVALPGGEVERHYRVPRSRPAHRNGKPGSVGEKEAPCGPPTANDLSDRQQAALFAHQAIAVRHAAAGSALVRKRLLVLALHEKVRTDGLSIRHEANATTLHAGQSESIGSGTFAALKARREDLDPFKADHSLDEAEAYRRLCELPEKALDKLIGVLIIDCLTGHGQRPTPLLATLQEELGVSIRTHWTPDAQWLGGYQKIQLADLVGTLKGSVHGSAALNRKKSELVDELAALFSQAATDPKSFDDAGVADRVNAWTPVTATQ